MHSGKVVWRREFPVTVRQDFDDFDRGWDFFAVYHSHTHSPAYPSPTDIRLAEPWPETFFILAFST